MRSKNGRKGGYNPHKCALKKNGRLRECVRTILICEMCLDTLVETEHITTHEVQSFIVKRTSAPIGARK